mmetsp:Transcript_24780/g.69020  ORF Transcript_24780/g.69020 Transcript_24780/m.69020 type:complete len:139 (-) Transcript_24780:957-1373(-)
MEEKEEMLRYVGDEVERCKQLFDEKEARLKAARDKALREVENAMRERNESQSMLEEMRAQVAALTGGAERERARAEQAGVAAERSKAELARAQQRVARVEDEMRELLRAHDAQKVAGNQKFAALAKMLHDLQGTEQLY